MDIALWSVTGILALVFLAAGMSKLTQPKQKLHDSGLTFVEDFPARTIKLIGLLEVLGALGLVLPALLDTATVLVPVAATGLALLMAGAVVVHLRRKEGFLLPLVLGVFAALVAILRFGAYAF